MSNQQVNMTVSGVEHAIRKKRKRVSLEGISQLTSLLRSHRHLASVNSTQFTINTRRPSLDRRRPDDHMQYDWTIQADGVHYARNRSSFSTYTHLNFQLSDGEWCQGIGSVHLEILTPDGPTTITLHHVLHLPRAICNGISMSLFDQSQITFSPVDGARDPNGNIVWLTECFHGFYRLVLPGGLLRDTSLDGTLKTGVRPEGDTLSVCLSERDITRIQEALPIDAF